MGSVPPAVTVRAEFLYLTAPARFEMYPRPRARPALKNFFESCAGMNIANLPDSSMAACLVFVLPMLIMYLFLQRRFIASIASTGIVG